MPVMMSRRCVHQSYGRFDFVEPDSVDQRSGLAFRRTMSCPAGRFAWLLQLQVDKDALEILQTIDISICDLATDDILAEVSLRAGNGDLTLECLDSIVLRTDSAVSRNLELRGHVTGALRKVRLRHVKVLEIGDGCQSRDIFYDEKAEFRTDTIKAVFIGATNICNANCPHCPTNKRVTAHLPQGTMDIVLFERLLHELQGIRITDGFLFGVFGEPFMDPLLEDRIEIIRRLRPGHNIDIATNAGAIDPQRLLRILPHLRHIGIHVEASTPEQYDKLMWPLKATTVFPLVDRLINVAPDKAYITTPLHRGNCHEVAAIRHRWGRYGSDIRFSALQTRGTERTSAMHNSLAPTACFWPSDMLDILVVDWDGEVLLTCDDFLRRQSLGNLYTQTLHEILNGEARRRAFEALRTYRWVELPSFYDAVIDDVRAVESYATAGIHTVPVMQLAAEAFQLGRGATKEPGAIRLCGGGEPSEPMVYGPYLSLPAGHYIVRFRGRAPTDGRLSLQFEVSSRFGQNSLGVAYREGHELSRLDLALEFHHTDSAETIEFRILPRTGGAEDIFWFGGATLSCIGT